MEWDDIRHFLALARTGSVRAAGGELGVSHSTVARRVEALEARLSTRLFDRTRNGYTLSEAGEQMLPGAERVEQEMSELERSLIGKDARLAGAITLTCCDAFVSDLILSELRPFCDAHVDIELTFLQDSRPFDLSKREADIAVRTLGRGAIPPEHLIGTRLAPVTFANYVAVAHADRLDPEVGNNTPRWIATDDKRTMDALVASSSYPDLAPWGAFASLGLMAQAARAGLGIVMLPTYGGDRDPALRRLAKPDVRHLADLWLLSHPDLRDNARFKATRATVVEIFKRRASLFSGDAPIAVR
jgi:DNA-binding transcriptional LysR family regulator